VLSQVYVLLVWAEPQAQLIKDDILSALIRDETLCMRENCMVQDNLQLLQKNLHFTPMGPKALSPGHAKSDVDPFIPINSAGEHTGTGKVVDVVLLFCALLLPFLIFWIIRWWERGSDDYARAPGNRQLNDVLRTGSTYRLESSQQRVSLEPPFARKTEDSEGPALQNILAGFSTAMAALPDAISFSFITGVSPLNGIWAGAFMGLSAALIGGRPGMISSASAATAVVLADVSLDKELGMAAMALCVFIVGILQIIAGCMRLSRFVTLIPHPVMLGFVNGLAIVMVRAQLRQFHQKGDGPWVESHVMLSMIITALFAMATAIAWSKIPHASKFLPAPLASVVLTVCFSIIFGGLLERRTLRDVAGAHTFAGGLTAMPSWDFPPVGLVWNSGRMWGKVIATAVRFAIVGLLESMMTEALIDQITKTSGSMRRECFGQGVGNILSSLFGTQGGCALIAQSLMNVSSGGRSRLSGVVMGITLALSVLLLAPVMAIIPVAALVGLITLIALNTFAWGSLELITRINWIDSMVVVVVTVVTVWQDLATAVVTGIIINALGFAWHSSTQVTVISDLTAQGERCFTLRGPLFFGSAMNYQNAVTSSPVAEETVVLDFSNSNVLDISAVDAITKTRECLRGAGKIVVMKGLPSDVILDLDGEKVAEHSKEDEKDSAIKKF